MGFLWFGRKKKKETPVEEASINPSTANKSLSMMSEGENFKEPESLPSKPRLSMRVKLSNGTLSVFLPDGTILGTPNGSRDLYYKVLNCETIEEVIMLLDVPIDQEESKGSMEALEVKERKENMKEFVQVKKKVGKLEATNKFYVSGNDLLMEGSPVPLPPIMISAFEEVIEDEKKFSALQCFWLWLSMCPNPESRRDAYRFIEKNDVRITPHGLLVLYRSILKVETGGNKRLLEFATNAFAKVKMWKKSPKNFIVYEDANGNYTTLKSEVALPEGSKKVGILSELVEQLKDAEENLYTDNFSKTKQIKLRSVYEIDEAEINTDNSVECSSGLHVGSKSFGINSFGNTRVMCLVNPMYIRAVPRYDSHKMRVKEMFIAATMEGQEYTDEEAEDLVDLDEEYFSISLEQLKNRVSSSEVKIDDNDKSELRMNNNLTTGAKSAIVENLESIKQALSTRTKKLK